MKKIAFVWAKYAPYHLDRIEAVRNLLGDQYDTIAIQKTGRSQIYDWHEVRVDRKFPLITLFPETERVPFWKMLFLLCRELLRPGVHYVFICNYEFAYTFFAAIICRLFRRRIFVMNDSKFDDKPRLLRRELFKSLMYLPYHGALASGRRTAEYLRFLGFGKRPMALGYDSLSIERVRRNAASPPAPDGVPFTERHFTVVARFVPKKNLLMLMDAYASYRQMAGDNARELHLCGSGPEEEKIHARIAELGISGVVFHGFLQEEGVAEVLATSLALVLPSYEEQWGLVVNEALALGLPILCSDNIGARDLLVRSGVNGQIVEPDNPQGLAQFMFELSQNEVCWQRMSKASLELAPLGDTLHFAQGVEILINKVP